MGGIWPFRRDLKRRMTIGAVQQLSPRQRLPTLSPSPQTANTIVGADDREAGRIGLIAATPLGRHLLERPADGGNQPRGCPRFRRTINDTQL